MVDASRRVVLVLVFVSAGGLVRRRGTQAADNVSLKLPPDAWLMALTSLLHQQRGFSRRHERLVQPVRHAHVLQTIVPIQVIVLVAQPQSKYDARTVSIRSFPDQN